MPRMLVQAYILRGVSTEAAHLIRLGDVLAERGAPVSPILAAVTTAGTSSVYLAVSMRSRRIDLLVPFHPDALAAVAPQAAPPLAGHLGISDVQRTMWKKLHPTFGSGASVSVSTQCSSVVPTPELGFTYLSTEWDQAVQLTSAIVDVDSARQVAAALGCLAGTLHSDHLRAMELVVGPQAVPDVVVWITLRPD